MYTSQFFVFCVVLDGMTDHLSHMVSDVRSNSSVVAQAGLLLASDIGQLSRRTEHQAASLCSKWMKACGTWRWLG